MALVFFRFFALGYIATLSGKMSPRLLTEVTRCHIGRSFYLLISVFITSGKTFKTFYVVVHVVYKLVCIRLVRVKKQTHRFSTHSPSKHRNPFYCVAFTAINVFLVLY